MNRVKSIYNVSKFNNSIIGINKQINYSGIGSLQRVKSQNILVQQQRSLDDQDNISYNKRNYGILSDIVNNCRNIIASNPSYAKVFEEFSEKYGYFSSFVPDKKPPPPPPQDPTQPEQPPPEDTHGYDEKEEEEKAKKKEEAKKQRTEEEVRKQREELREFLNEQQKKKKKRFNMTTEDPNETYISPELDLHFTQSKERARGIRPEPLEMDRPELEYITDCVTLRKSSMYKLFPNPPSYGTSTPPEERFMTELTVYEYRLEQMNNSIAVLKKAEEEMRSMDTPPEGLPEVDWDSFEDFDEFQENLHPFWKEWIFEQQEKEKERIQPYMVPTKYIAPPWKPFDYIKAVYMGFWRTVDLVTRFIPKHKPLLLTFYMKMFNSKNPLNKVLHDYREFLLPEVNFPHIHRDVKCNTIPEFFYHFYKGNLRELEYFTTPENFRMQKRMIESMEAGNRIMDHTLVRKPRTKFIKFSSNEESTHLEFEYMTSCNYIVGFRDYEGVPQDIGNEGDCVYRAINRVYVCAILRENADEFFDFPMVVDRVVPYGYPRINKRATAILRRLKKKQLEQADLEELDKDENNDDDIEEEEDDGEDKDEKEKSGKQKSDKDSTEKKSTSSKKSNENNKKDSDKK
ncbi:hypothetical protein DLAC_08911 [Tieghemostelium lacteum]|uniref:Uncharacterized protein n=1 Tax=Tieghemostelium lacteum TaxID=361077 RepID=A0A151Z8L5_TIELA|nr:hypothetical protein DLAC_08911 [Tieghemostelium lacteum]|eukprot:KYQ90309.1 hypothetical protein DLAC_08911 [Tieghemostelium lacteum]